MGAVNVTRSVEAMPEADLKVWFKDTVAQMGYESGHDPYSGNWTTNEGLCILPGAYKTENEAYRVLEARAQKRGPVLAVKVGDFSKSFPETKAEKALVEKFKELSEALDTFDWHVLQRAMSAKSNTKKCPHCGSSINIKAMCNVTLAEFKRASEDSRGIPSSLVLSRGRRLYISMMHLTDCPVCNKNLLMTESDFKKLDSLRKRRDEAHLKVSTARTAWEAKNPPQPRAFWLLYGLSAC